MVAAPVGSRLPGGRLRDGIERSASVARVLGSIAPIGNISPPVLDGC